MLFFTWGIKGHPELLESGEEGWEGGAESWERSWSPARIPGYVRKQEDHHKKKEQEDHRIIKERVEVSDEMRIQNQNTEAE